MTSVVIDRVFKSFGTVSVLRDVSLSIPAGEFLTLLGPSGCGKSTLLRILAGLESQDAGSVSIGGRDVDGMRPKRRDVAMVFQSYALYPHMTVAQNMALPLRMRRLSAWQRLPAIGQLLPRSTAILAEIEAEVIRTAKALDIGHLLARKPGQLSGGQRQRVAVGRAMVRNPAVFLMDEPLSNLDAKLRVLMRAEIKELHRRLGVTFIYVTHDQGEAMTLSDRVAVMMDGEILQLAPPQEIYADPHSRSVAEFIGSPKINMLDGVVRERNMVACAGTTLAVLTDAARGTNLTLGIRPEAFTMAERLGKDSLTGSVRLIEHMGSDLYVHLVVLGIAEPLIVRFSAESAPRIEIGETVSVAVRPEKVLIFARDGQRIRSRVSGGKVAAMPGGASVATLREHLR